MVIYVHSNRFVELAINPPPPPPPPPPPEETKSLKYECLSCL